MHGWSDSNRSRSENPVSEKASELFPPLPSSLKEATLDGNELTGRRPLLLIVFRLYTYTANPLSRRSRCPRTPTSNCNHGFRLADPAVSIQPPVTAVGLVVPLVQLSIFSHQ